MKIKRRDIYYIELYLEPGKISDHNKRSNGTLSFTGVELMDAIVSAGMPDIYLNKANKRNRKEGYISKLNCLKHMLLYRQMENFYSILQEKSIWIVQKLVQLIIGLE